MRYIKSVLFTILFINLLFTSYTQEITYGILNRDLVFLRDQKVALEPGESLPDSLTIPDSILVNKGAFIYIQSTIRDTFVFQTLYVTNAYQEMSTTIVLSRNDMITQQNQYYQTLDEIPQNYFKKNRSKSINVFGVYSSNSPNVSYLCTTNKNNSLFEHHSQVSNVFLRSTIYHPQQKVFVYDNSSIRYTSYISSNLSTDCINSLILDTSRIKTSIPNYAIVSFQKINAKKNHTPNYQLLLSRVKNFENNTGNASDLRTTFIGAFDVNNDHINEIIFEVTGSENHSYLVYEFQSEWKLIYAGGGCSY